MRTPEFTGQFKRDYKREKKGRYGATIESDLGAVLFALLLDQSWESRDRDHVLVGAWRDYRDCHIKPDFVLIYQKPDEVSLRLVRLGSHSQLGL